MIKRKVRQYFICMLLLCSVFHVQAQSVSGNEQTDLQSFVAAGDFELVKPRVLEPTMFYGLASYYNAIAFYVLSGDAPQPVEPGQTIHLAQGEQFAAVGRFEVLLLGGAAVDVAVTEESFTFSGAVGNDLEAHLLRKDQLAASGPTQNQLRYEHLWTPFALLSRAVEWSLVRLQAACGLGWGMTIVVFSILLKLLLVPLGVVAARMQARVSQYQSQLMPKLAEIKASYDGEEAHKRIMAAHKELGISTFFALKPLLVMFIQVPVWIAVFNALGEMPQLTGQGFLWIEDLAYPDSVATLPMALPLLGDSVSLLPVLMTVVTIISALLFQDRHAPPQELKRQKRNLFFMALAFFLLFYPFPAAMVLYWTLSNALQIVQQRMIRV